MGERDGGEENVAAISRGRGEPRMNAENADEENALSGVVWAKPCSTRAFGSFLPSYQRLLRSSAVCLLSDGRSVLQTCE